jgi:NAD(P)-dependent dehydrogenase (short-subunit alcohol dehydrogenase family)
MTTFAGTTTIVTGGARGIGERLAEDIVAQGGNVVIGDVNRDLGEKLSSRLGAKAKFIELDVSRSSDCNRAVEMAQSAFGGLDFLVNCAISMNAKRLIELSETEWRKTLDIGLTGTFLMSQVFAARLVQENEPGAIVNISSIGGRHPYGGAGSYSAAKAGIILLTEQMALEWAQYGIRVNAVAPGTIETPLMTAATLRSDSATSLMRPPLWIERSTGPAVIPAARSQSWTACTGRRMWPCGMAISCSAIVTR